MFKPFTHREYYIPSNKVLIFILTMALLAFPFVSVQGQVIIQSKPCATHGQISWRDVQGSRSVITGAVIPSSLVLRCHLRVAQGG